MYLQSAGTALPHASNTMSPGTTNVALMFCHFPSRLTVAEGLREACGGRGEEGGGVRGGEGGGGEG